MNCNEQKTILEENLRELTKELTRESQELEQEIREDAAKIDPDIDTSGPDMWIGLDIDVSWKKVNFSLDLPEIEFVDQKWVLDLPQVTMKQQEIVFHTPSVRMKTVRGPDIPEVVCKMVMKDFGLIKTKVPECKTRMKKTYLDIPESFMEKQRIVLSIPEFRIDQTEMELSVPEFTMKTQGFSLHLPQVTVKNIRVESEEAKKAGDALSEDAKRRGEELKLGFVTTAKVELGGDVAQLYACYRRQLEASKIETLQRFEAGASSLQSVIASMVNSKVPEDNPRLKQARQSLATVYENREAFMRNTLDNLSKLAEQERSFFERLAKG